MELVVAGVAVANPERAAADPKLLVAELASKFEWDDKVGKYLVEVVWLSTLEDFVHLFSSESDVPAAVKKMGLDEGIELLMVARVRKAWLGVREAWEEAKKMRQKNSDDPDLDAVLPKPELDSMAEFFWRRYKISFPANVAMADQGKSRLRRELNLRLLSVRPISKVATQIHQILAERKKRNITADLVMIEEEVVEDPAGAPVTVSKYMFKLRILCTGYAEVGAKPVPGAPQTENRGDDSSEFVECPMDVIMRYFYRAEKQVAKVAPDRALAWLRDRDENEREAWVELYRSSKLTIGKVIQRLYTERESLWVVEGGRKRPAPEEHVQGHGEGYAFPPGGRAMLRPRDESELGRTMAMTKGRRQICSDWNRGICREPCPRGFIHFCSREIKGDRACGMTNHRAKDC